MKTKICPKCGLIKPLTSEFFYRDRSSRTGFSGYCKTCQNLNSGAYAKKNRDKINKRQNERNKTYSSRTKKYQKLYGITCYAVDKMWKEQGCKCAICKEPVERYDVDHDHITDKVRGLLCHQCNVGLGQFKDNIEVFKEAIRYLENGKE